MIFNISNHFTVWCV